MKDSEEVPQRLSWRLDIDGKHYLPEVRSNHYLAVPVIVTHTSKSRTNCPIPVNLQLKLLSICKIHLV